MSATLDRNTACRKTAESARAKGYIADWKPHRKTLELIGAVQAILHEYRAHLPLTLRQIFYRLVGAYGYEKTEIAYNRLSGHLVNARRARVIPFGALRDDGIVTYSSRWHEGVEDFWDDAIDRAHEYRRDRQAGQRQYVELWCEAAGMAPQLARVADEFSVPVFSNGRYQSLPAVRFIVDRVVRRDVPTTLLHIGDLDPTGQSMYDTLVEDTNAFLDEDRIIATQRIQARRLALTAEQVQRYELPTAPPKAADSRSKSWGGGETCQLEALAPDALFSIVRDALEGIFDPERLDREIKSEARDRTQLLRALPEGGEA